MLNALRFFRHLCVDPSPRGQQATADLPLEQYRAVSPKFDWLIQQLDAIRNLNEKAIIFVEMRDVQRQLKQYLEQRYALKVAMINGETSTALGSPNSRQRLIDVFQDHQGFNVIILSPLAAGVGLNIQQANHVIHYVRHWNPAREDQATDRAYRIGQTRDVTVYTPTVRGPGWMSFEETLDRLLALKRQLAGDMLDGIDDVERDLIREIARFPGTPVADH
jgi:SNF2 family DNA or RNA helicase